MKILKFGGSSISSAERINSVCDIIKNEYQRKSVVVSAMGGVTDLLIKLAEEKNKSKYETIFNDIKKKHLQCVKKLKLKKVEFIDNYFIELQKVSKNYKIDLKEKKDQILCFGELLSSKIISTNLSENFEVEAEQLDARKVIKTNESYGNAFVYLEESSLLIKKYFSKINKVQIITGFLGSSENGNSTTLGRSGSDYTASIFGAALKVSLIEIWTDVNGILSANPKIVKNVVNIPKLNYEEAMELAHAGAKVIFPPTMIPALYNNIPIKIKNTFNLKNKGSLISNEVTKNKKNPIIGISSLSNIILIRLEGAGLVGVKGIIGRLFSKLAQNEINIILISMSFSEHSVCFAINPEFEKTALSNLKKEFQDEIQNKQIDKISSEKNLSIIGVVGNGMINKPGISGDLFKTLGDNNINVIAIAQGSSERNISFITKEADLHKTINVLHNKFFSKDKNDANIYLLGVGNIGKEFLNLTFKNNNKFNLKLIANSKYYIDDFKIKSNSKIISELNKSNKKFDLDILLNSDLSKKHKNIIIDCTSSKSVAKKYSKFFKKGFSIIAANKNANTLSQNYYEQLKKDQIDHNVKFKYETNVGAGLPMVSTIQSLYNSNDKIISFEGILSGTLSYLFKKYDGKKKFSDILIEAHKKGYTEPDPRFDLNGLDVGKKMLILLRESGIKYELEDIKIQSLIPKSINSKISIEDFFIELKKNESFYESRLKESIKKNEVLRYIASWDGKNAKVELASIPVSNPFYSIKEKENILVIKSKNYSDIPIIIRGPGAGIKVTSAGVFNDLSLIL